MIKQLQSILNTWGLNETLAVYVGWIAIIVAILILAFVANYIARRILLVGVSRLVKRTKTAWDDALLENKVFTRLSHIAPALAIYFSATIFPAELQGYIQRLSAIYMILTAVFVLSAFLNATVDIYRTFETSKHKPIKGYMMSESGGRRIKRSISVDMTSVKWLTPSSFATWVWAAPSSVTRRTASTLNSRV